MWKSWQSWLVRIAEAHCLSVCFSSFDHPFRGRSLRRRRRPRRLKLEACEPRQMLSADAPLHNAVDPYDVNDDTFVTPIDLLHIVNAVNGGPLPGNEPIYLDVNGDGVFNLDDYYFQRGAYDDPDEYDAPDTEFFDVTSVSGPSGPYGESVPAEPASQTVASGPSGPTGATGVYGTSGPSGPTTYTFPTGSPGKIVQSGLTGPEGATGPAGFSAPSGTTGTNGATAPSGISDPADPAVATGPTGPSASDDSTGLMQSPTACDTNGSPPQLTGGSANRLSEASADRSSGLSVNEGDELNLGYIPDENPEGHEVVWVFVEADGMSHTFLAGDDAVIIFMDDNPTNTPSDDVEVELTFVLIGDCGELYEETQTRTVTVHNVPPTANDDTLRVGNQVSGTIEVLENDTDPGMDTLSIASIDTSATNGTVSHIGGGSIEYVPGNYYACLGEGETATDTFEYAIHDDDDHDSTSSATVTVTVVGSRQVIWVTYGSGPSSEDDGNGNPSPAHSYISLDPAPTCGDVTVEHVPADTPAPWDEYLEPGQVADSSDIENSSGSVVIPNNTSVAEFDLVPVDDELIERTEWYFWTVEVEDTDNYVFMVDQEPAVTHIEDDEWRFVAESRTESKGMRLLSVEAFSGLLPTPFTSKLSGGVDYIADYTTEYGSAADSTGTAEARAFAELTRYRDDNAAWQRMYFQFTCDSQTGDIRKNANTEDGDHSDGPLAVHNNLAFDINDIGDQESNVYVELKTKFLAGGEITSGATVSGSTGRGKGKASGTYGFTSEVTYSGGRQSVRSASFNLTCKRGE